MRPFHRLTFLFVLLSPPAFTASALPHAESTWAPEAQDPVIDDLIARGRVLLDAGKPREAQALFDEADERNKNGIETRVWVLRAWQDQGRINDSFDEIDRMRSAGAEGPAVSYVYGMGSYLRALKTLAQGADNTTAFAFQDAVQHLSKATDGDPETFGKGFKYLAHAAWYSTQLDVAAAAAAKALEHAPRDGEVRVIAGRIAFSRFSAANGRAPEEEGTKALLAEAIEHFARGAELLPKERTNASSIGEAFKQLGDGHIWNQDKAAAADAYAHALEWDPTQVDFNQLWNVLYSQEKGKEVDTLLSCLERGASAFEKRWGKSTSSDATLLWWLGYTQFTASQFEAADASFVRAVKKWPAYADSWWYVGLSRYHRQDYLGACEAWRELWRADPTSLVRMIDSNKRLHIDIIDFTGAKLAELGQPPTGRQPERNLDAAFLYEVLTGVQADNWNWYNNMGLFLRDGGVWQKEHEQPDAAKRSWEKGLVAYDKAIELAPDKPHLYNDKAVILHYNLQRDLPEAKALYEKALKMATEMLVKGGLSDDDKAMAETARRDATTNLQALERGDRRR